MSSTEAKKILAAYNLYKGTASTPNVSKKSKSYVTPEGYVVDTDTGKVYIDAAKTIPVSSGVVRSTQPQSYTISLVENLGITPIVRTPVISTPTVQTKVIPQALPLDTPAVSFIGPKSTQYTKPIGPPSQPSVPDRPLSLSEAAIRGQIPTTIPTTIGPRLDTTISYDQLLTQRSPIGELKEQQLPPQKMVERLRADVAQDGAKLAQVNQQISIERNRVGAQSGKPYITDYEAKQKSPILTQLFDERDALEASINEIKKELKVAIKESKEAKKQEPEKPDDLIAQTQRAFSGIVGYNPMASRFTIKIPKAEVVSPEARTATIGGAGSLWDPGFTLESFAKKTLEILDRSPIPAIPTVEAVPSMETVQQVTKTDKRKSVFGPSEKSLGIEIPSFGIPITAEDRKAFGETVGPTQPLEIQGIALTDKEIEKAVTSYSPEDDVKQLGDIAKQIEGDTRIPTGEKPGKEVTGQRDLMDEQTRQLQLIGNNLQETVLKRLKGQREEVGEVEDVFKTASDIVAKEGRFLTPSGSQVKIGTEGSYIVLDETGKRIRVPGRTIGPESDEGKVIRDIYAEQAQTLFDNMAQRAYWEKLTLGDVSIADALLKPRTLNVTVKYDKDGGIKTVTEGVTPEREAMIRQYFDERGISLDEKLSSIRLGPVKYEAARVGAKAGVPGDLTSLVTPDLFRKGAEEQRPTVVYDAEGKPIDVTTPKIAPIYPVETDLEKSVAQQREDYLGSLKDFIQQSRYPVQGYFTLSPESVEQIDVQTKATLSQYPDAAEFDIVAVNPETNKQEVIKTSRLNLELNYSEKVREGWDVQYIVPRGAGEEITRAAGIKEPTVETKEGISTIGPAPGVAQFLTGYPIAIGNLAALLSPKPGVGIEPVKPEKIRKVTDPVTGKEIDIVETTSLGIELPSGYRKEKGGLVKREAQYGLTPLLNIANSLEASIKNLLERGEKGRVYEPVLYYTDEETIYDRLTRAIDERWISSTDPNIIQRLVKETPNIPRILGDAQFYREAFVPEYLREELPLKTRIESYIDELGSWQSPGYKITSGFTSSATYVLPVGPGKKVAVEGAEKLGEIATKSAAKISPKLAEKIGPTLTKKIPEAIETIYSPQKTIAEQAKKLKPILTPITESEAFKRISAAVPRLQPRFEGRVGDIISSIPVIGKRYVLTQDDILAAVRTGQEPLVEDVGSFAYSIRRDIFQTGEGELHIPPDLFPLPRGPTTLKPWEALPITSQRLEEVRALQRAELKSLEQRREKLSRERPAMVQRELELYKRRIGKEEWQKLPESEKQRIERGISERTTAYQYPEIVTPFEGRWTIEDIVQGSGRIPKEVPVGYYIEPSFYTSIPQPRKVTTKIRRQPPKGTEAPPEIQIPFTVPGDIYQIEGRRVIDLAQAPKKVQKKINKQTEEIATLQGRIDAFRKQIANIFISESNKLKEAGPKKGFVRLYRAEVDPVKKDIEVEGISKLTGEAAEIAKIQQDASGVTKARGRWFTDDPDTLDFYIGEIDPKRVRVVYTDVPKSVVEKYRVSNLPDDFTVIPKEQAEKVGLKKTTVKDFSRSPKKEIFLPQEYVKTKPIKINESTLTDIVEGRIKVTKVLLPERKLTMSMIKELEPTLPVSKKGELRELRGKIEGTEKQISRLEKQKRVEISRIKPLQQIVDPLGIVGADFIRGIPQGMKLTEREYQENLSRGAKLAEVFSGVKGLKKLVTSGEIPATEAKKGADVELYFTEIVAEGKTIKTKVPGTGGTPFSRIFGPSKILGIPFPKKTKYSTVPGKQDIIKIMAVTPRKLKAKARGDIIPLMAGKTVNDVEGWDAARLALGMEQIDISETQKAMKLLDLDEAVKQRFVRGAEDEELVAAKFDIQALKDAAKLAKSKKNYNQAARFELAAKNAEDALDIYQSGVINQNIVGEFERITKQIPNTFDELRVDAEVTTKPKEFEEYFADIVRINRERGISEKESEKNLVENLQSFLLFQRTKDPTAPNYLTPRQAELILSAIKLDTKTGSAVTDLINKFAKGEPIEAISETLRKQRQVSALERAKANITTEFLKEEIKTNRQRLLLDEGSVDAIRTARKEAVEKEAELRAQKKQLESELEKHQDMASGARQKINIASGNLESVDVAKIVGSDKIVNMEKIGEEINKIEARRGDAIRQLFAINEEYDKVVNNLKSASYKVRAKTGTTKYITPGKIPKFKDYNAAISWLRRKQSRLQKEGSIQGDFKEDVAEVLEREKITAAPSPLTDFERRELEKSIAQKRFQVEKLKKDKKSVDKLDDEMNEKLTKLESERKFYSSDPKYSGALKNVEDDIVDVKKTLARAKTTREKVKELDKIQKEVDELEDKLRQSKREPLGGAEESIPTPNIDEVMKVYNKQLTKRQEYEESLKKLDLLKSSRKKFEGDLTQDATAIQTLKKKLEAEREAFKREVRASKLEDNPFYASVIEKGTIPKALTPQKGLRVEKPLTDAQKDQIRSLLAQKESLVKDEIISGTQRIDYANQLLDINSELVAAKMNIVRDYVNRIALPEFLDKKFSRPANINDFMGLVKSKLKEKGLADDVIEKYISVKKDGKRVSASGAIKDDLIDILKEEDDNISVAFGKFLSKAREARVLSSGQKITPIARADDVSIEALKEKIKNKFVTDGKLAKLTEREEAAIDVYGVLDEAITEYSDRYITANRDLLKQRQIFETKSSKLSAEELLAKIKTDKEVKAWKSQLNKLLWVGDDKAVASEVARRGKTPDIRLGETQRQYQDRLARQAFRKYVKGLPVSEEEREQRRMESFQKFMEMTSGKELKETGKSKALKGDWSTRDILDKDPSIITEHRNAYKPGYIPEETIKDIKLNDDRVLNYILKQIKDKTGRDETQIKKAIEEVKPIQEKFHNTLDSYEVAGSRYEQITDKQMKNQASLNQYGDWIDFTPINANFADIESGFRQQVAADFMRKRTAAKLGFVKKQLREAESTASSLEKQEELVKSGKYGQELGIKRIGSVVMMDVYNTIPELEAKIKSAKLRGNKELVLRLENQKTKLREQLIKTGEMISTSDVPPPGAKVFNIYQTSASFIKELSKNVDLFGRQLPDEPISLRAMDIPEKDRKQLELASFFTYKPLRDKTGALVYKAPEKYDVILNTERKGLKELEDDLTKAQASQDYSQVDRINTRIKEKLIRIGKIEDEKRLAAQPVKTIKTNIRGFVKSTLNKQGFDIDRLKNMLAVTRYDAAKREVRDPGKLVESLTKQNDVLLGELKVAKKPKYYNTILTKEYNNLKSLSNKKAAAKDPEQIAKYDDQIQATQKKIDALREKRDADKEILDSFGAITPEIEKLQEKMLNIRDTITEHRVAFGEANRKKLQSQLDDRMKEREELQKDIEYFSQKGRQGIMQPGTYKYTSYDRLLTKKEFKQMKLKEVESEISVLKNRMKKSDNIAEMFKIKEQKAVSASKTSSDAMIARQNVKKEQQAIIKTLEQKLEEVESKLGNTIFRQKDLLATRYGRDAALYGGKTIDDIAIQKLKSLTPLSDTGQVLNINALGREVNVGEVFATVPKTWTAEKKLAAQEKIRELKTRLQLEKEKLTDDLIEQQQVEAELLVSPKFDEKKVATARLRINEIKTHLADIDAKYGQKVLKDVFSDFKSTDVRPAYKIGSMQKLIDSFKEGLNEGKTVKAKRTRLLQEEKEALPAETDISTLFEGMLREAYGQQPAQQPTIFYPPVGVGGVGTYTPGTIEEERRYAAGAPDVEISIPEIFPPGTTPPKSPQRQKSYSEMRMDALARQYEKLSQPARLGLIGPEVIEKGSFTPDFGITPGIKDLIDITPREAVLPKVVPKITPTQGLKPITITSLRDIQRLKPIEIQEQRPVLRVELTPIQRQRQEQIPRLTTDLITVPGVPGQPPPPPGFPPAFPPPRPFYFLTPGVRPKRSEKKKKLKKKRIGWYVPSTPFGYWDPREYEVGAKAWKAVKNDIDKMFNKRVFTR